MKNKFIVFIKTTISEVQIPGFGGMGAYEFQAEIETMDGVHLGENKITSMGRPSNLGFFNYGTRCVMELIQKPEGFYFQKVLQELKQ
jgi:hypothetical protein